MDWGFFAWILEIPLYAKWNWPIDFHFSRGLETLHAYVSLLWNKTDNCLKTWDIF